MKRVDLLAAVQSLAGEYGVNMFSDRHVSDHANIEAIAHEVAHAIEFGRNFEDRLNRLRDRTANAHEATTLRIEVEALRRLGMRVSLRRLWSEANWYGSPDDWPGWDEMIQPLTAKERAMVRRMVDGVREVAR